MIPARRATPVPLGQIRHECPVCSATDLRYEFLVDGVPACSCERCSLLFLNAHPAVTLDPQTATVSSPPDEDEADDLGKANVANLMSRLRRYAGLERGRLLWISAASKVASN